MVFSKIEVEKAIGENFFEIYNQHNKSSITIKRNGEQGKINEPDLISNNGIGIEIFSNQYSQENKRQIEVDIKLGANIVFSQDLLNPDENAYQFMLDKIKSKESKNYDFDGDIWLLIDCRDNPITTMKDFKGFFDKNQILESRFKEIRLFDHRALVSTSYKLEKSIGGAEMLNGSLYDDEYIVYRIF